MLPRGSLEEIQASTRQLGTRQAGRNLLGDLPNACLQLQLSKGLGVFHLEAGAPSSNIYETSCGCGSKNRYQDGALVSGNMAKAPRRHPPLR